MGEHITRYMFDQLQWYKIQIFFVNWTLICLGGRKLPIWKIFKFENSMLYTSIARFGLIGCSTLLLTSN